MHTGTNAQGLIGDGKRVIGVRATKDGKEICIKANKGVVIAVSGYEQNKVYTKTLSAQLDPKSVVFPGIDGANFRLAGPFGARIAKVPDISMVGVQVPGEEDEFGKPLWRSALLTIGMPHHIVVNRQGKRFGNEAFYRGFCYNLDVIDGGTQTHPNWPCWMIFDSQAREKYLCISVMPGQELPEGMGAKASTLADLANKVGIDARNLEATVAKFNDACAKNHDEDFKRGSHPWSAWFCGDPLHKPHPNLGPILKPPFYAVELHQTGVTAIPATGLVTDHHSQVIGWDDKPIEGLYAAGNSVARMETGAVMQSGVSNGRGMTYGYLAALHAAGKPSGLLPKEIARMGL
jgi:3-oxosteroid 1-dehydrogenase